MRKLISALAVMLCMVSFANGQGTGRVTAKAVWADSIVWRNATTKTLSVIVSRTSGNSVVYTGATGAVLQYQVPITFSGTATSLFRLQSVVKATRDGWTSIPGGSFVYVSDPGYLSFKKSGTIAWRKVLDVDDITPPGTDGYFRWDAGPDTATVSTGIPQGDVTGLASTLASKANTSGVGSLASASTQRVTINGGASATFDFAVDGTYTVDVAANLITAGTSHSRLSMGSSGERPTVPVNGYSRLNSTFKLNEEYQDGAWDNYVKESQVPQIQGFNGEVLVSNSGGAIGIPKAQAATALATNSAGTATWMGVETGWALKEEWISTTTAGNIGWGHYESGTAGAVSITNTNADGNHPGLVRFYAGTDAAGYAGLNLGSTPLLLGNGECVVKMDVFIPVLATGAEKFIVKVGLLDTNNGTEPVDGVYFTYEADSSANWRVCTSSNSSRTRTTTDFTVLAATWMKLMFVVNGDGTNVDFYINGILRSSITSVGSTIPITAGRLTAPNCVVLGVATIGGTGRLFDMDYFSIQQFFRTAR